MNSKNYSGQEAVICRDLCAAVAFSDIKKYQQIQNRVNLLNLNYAKVIIPPPLISRKIHVTFLVLV